MTGRLDAVDLDTDVVLLALKHADGPIPFEVLAKRTTTADLSDTPIDDITEVDVVDAVRMFVDIGFVTSADGDVKLTDRGVNMADHLAEHAPESLFG